LLVLQAQPQEAEAYAPGENIRAALLGLRVAACVRSCLSGANGENIMLLLTLNLSETETQTYASKRESIRADALRFARKRGQRFAQIVGTDGRILDVLEAM
jgi:hypothetical protein